MLQRVLKLLTGGGETTAAPRAAATPVELPSLRPPQALQSVMDPVPVVEHGPRHDGAPVPYYPRSGPAVPAASPEKLIATQAVLIRELRQASALSFAEFDEFIRPAIARYAEFVHLLPASEYHHHSDLGGLFRHGLEVALNACRRAEGKEFALYEDPCVRKFQIFRWRACVLLGGMLHDLGKAVIDVGAVSEGGKHEWNPHVQSLWDWLQEHDIPYYTIDWRVGRKHKEHDAISATVLTRILPDETMRWMSEHRGRLAYDAMLMALVKISDPSNPLPEIINLADGDSVAADLVAAQRRQASVGEAGSRARAAVFVRAMRDLVLNGKWTINRWGGPLWYGTEGLFGQYPECIDETVKHLNDNGVTIHNDREKLLDLLIETRVVVPLQTSDGKTIKVHHLKLYPADAKGNTMELKAPAMKFANEHIVPDYFVMPAPTEIQVFDAAGNRIGHGTVEPYGDTGATVVSEANATPTPATSPGAAESSAPPKAAAGGAGMSPARTRKRPAKNEGGAGAGVIGAEELAGDTEYFSATVDDEDLGSTPLPEEDLPPAEPVLRDRRNEPDLRDALLQESARHDRDPFPPTTVDGAKRWLADQEHGIYLSHVVDGLRANELVWNRDVFDVDDAIYVAFPSAFEGCGSEPTLVRDHFASCGWLEKDPVQPKRTTVPVPGRDDRINSLPFNHGVSCALRLLLPPPPKPAVDVGPYIRGRNAAYFKERVSSYEVSAVIVRVGFHECLSDQYKDAQDGWTSASENHIQHAVADFAKRHKKPYTVILKYLKHGANGLLLAKPDLGTVPNPDYSVEDDQARLDDVMSKFDPDGNPL